MASVGQELLDAPIGEMIKSMAEAIAEAQHQLDTTSLQIAQMMSGFNPKDRVQFGRRTYSLLELGFNPTFYQFVDTLIEVKMAVTMTRSTSHSVSSSQRWSYHCYAASVNASYSSKFSYSVEGSSVLRTKIVPVPPPGILEDRIRDMIELENQMAAENSETEEE